MSFPILEKKSADPAAGAELSFTADENMIVHSVVFQLVSDATVADRLPTLVADDGADIFFRSFPSGTQQASQTINYCAFAGAHGQPEVFSEQVIVLPAGGLRIPKNGRLRLLTTALQAGDDYGAMTLQVERI